MIANKFLGALVGLVKPLAALGWSIVLTIVKVALLGWTMGVAVVTKSFPLFVAGLKGVGTALATFGSAVIKGLLRVVLLGWTMGVAFVTKSVPAFAAGLVSASKAVKAFGKATLVGGGPIVWLIAALVAFGVLAHELFKSFGEGGFFDIKEMFQFEKDFYAWVGRQWDKVLDIFRKPMRDLFGWIEHAWDEALYYIEHPEEVFAWLSKAVPGSFQWAKDAWQSVLDFFSNPVGGLFAWIADALPGWVKDLLGIGAAPTVTLPGPALQQLTAPVRLPETALGRLGVSPAIDAFPLPANTNVPASIPASLPATIGADGPLGGGLVPEPREAPRGGRLGIGRNARIEVDFRHLPSYARVNTDPGDADLDVTAGYSMAGAA